MERERENLGEARRWRRERKRKSKKKQRCWAVLAVAAQQQKRNERREAGAGSAGKGSAAKGESSQAEEDDHRIMHWIDGGWRGQKLPRLGKVGSRYWCMVYGVRDGFKAHVSFTAVETR